MVRHSSAGLGRIAHDAESINLRAGELLMLAPGARAYDADAVSCLRAAAEGAVIVVAGGATARKRSTAGTPSSKTPTSSRSCRAKPFPSKATT